VRTSFGTFVPPPPGTIGHKVEEDDGVPMSVIDEDIETEATYDMNMVNMVKTHDQLRKNLLSKLTYEKIWLRP